MKHTPHPAPQVLVSPLPSQCYAVPRRDQGSRLDLFLRGRIPGLSRTRVQQAIRRRVEVSRSHGGHSARPRPGLQLQEGDLVTIQPRRFDAGDTSVVPLAVLHRDAHLLALDKPAGMICQPNNRIRLGSVLFRARLQEGDAGLALAHRLDGETSGVLLLSRDLDASRHLALAFRQRQVEKSYLAVVYGRPATDEFTVDRPLGAARGSRVFIKQGVPSGGGGKPARTRFRVLHRTLSTSLVQANPETGRRHQIRVHLAEAGHAIVGDKLYGPDERYFIRTALGQFDSAMAARLGSPRHLLHAWRLALHHPADGRRLKIEAPLPDDMRRAAGINALDAEPGVDGAAVWELPRHR